MGIFDFFRKNNEKNNKEPIKEETKPLTFGKREVKPTSAQFTNEMYEGIWADGEYLKRVYEENIQHGIFIVPKYIKSIDMFAFSNLENLNKVILHDEVRYISPLAFKNCKNLTEVIGLENSKTMQTVNGFSSCINLRKISLPNSSWFISERAFAGCENLQTIEIPANVELIDSEAFAGCKNLTVTFLDNNEKYLQDYIKEQEEFQKQYEQEFANEYELKQSEIETDDNPQISNEEAESLYQDLGIKYRKFNIADKEFIMASGKIIIRPYALDGVKEVIAYNQDTIETIIKSGYKGKVTFIDRENQEKITVDHKAMDAYQKELASNLREKYYEQFLIPCGGTTDWLLNCKKNNYRAAGYTSNIVCEIPISFDSRIVVEDHTQPISHTQYTKEYEEFFTSVAFYKKELDNHSIYAPHEYERSYIVYFPYGARFNEDMLKQIGSALNGLIDKARDLPNTIANKEKILTIQTTQKKLLNIFLTGTKNKNAVLDIMKGITLPKQARKIREAREKKDWLPDIIEPIKEGSENRKTNNTEDSKSM